MKLAAVHAGATSDLGKVVQRELNDRLDARGFARFKLIVDGVIGPKTMFAARLMARYLGAQKSTYKSKMKDEIPVGVVRMIVNPGKRTHDQKFIAEVRMAHLKSQRAARKKATQETTQKHGGRRARTVNAFLARVGQHEVPMGSNRGPQVDIYERFWGFLGVAWCGITCGYMATVFGGVKGLHSDVAAVAAIENHARAGDAPYGRWISSREALQGAFLPVGSFGQHVTMKVTNLANGLIRTVAGNHNDSIAVVDYSQGAIRGAAAMNYP